MKIDNDLKRELVAFALTLVGMLATRQITDVDAIILALKKMVDMLEKAKATHTLEVVKTMDLDHVPFDEVQSLIHEVL